MAYYIERRKFGYECLHDMSKADVRKYMEGADEFDELTPVSGVRAHRWVKAMRHHSTDLYIRDDGRIGKAGCGC